MGIGMQGFYQFGVTDKWFISPGAAAKFYLEQYAVVLGFGSEQAGSIQRITILPQLRTDYYITEDFSIGLRVGYEVDAELYERDAIQETFVQAPFNTFFFGVQLGYFFYEL